MDDSRDAVRVKTSHSSLAVQAALGSDLPAQLATGYIATIQLAASQSSASQEATSQLANCISSWNKCILFCFVCLLCYVKLMMSYVDMLHHGNFSLQCKVYRFFLIYIIINLFIDFYYLWFFINGTTDFSCPVDLAPLALLLEFVPKCSGCSGLCSVLLTPPPGITEPFHHYLVLTNWFQWPVG